MNRNELKKKIDNIREQIGLLKEKETELCREFITMSGEGCKYDEKNREIGRGKNKYTIKEGRYYWTEFFKDEDTGQKIAIERSRPVKEDGVWDDELIKSLI
jgi:hypothetical protein